VAAEEALRDILFPSFVTRTMTICHSGAARAVTGIPLFYGSPPFWRNKVDVNPTLSPRRVALRFKVQKLFASRSAAVRPVGRNVFGTIEYLFFDRKNQQTAFATPASAQSFRIRDDDRPKSGEL
jgi:hypothetical protein